MEDNPVAETPTGNSARTSRQDNFVSGQIDTLMVRKFILLRYKIGYAQDKGGLAEGETMMRSKLMGDHESQSEMTDRPGNTGSVGEEPK